MHNKILLLHGALGSSSQLTLLNDAIKLNLDPVLYEFEAHGLKSPYQNAFTVESLSENLMSFIRSEGLNQTPVFGYSLGGYVALYTASVFPEWKVPIITLGTKFDWSPQTVNEKFGFLNPETIENEWPALAQSLSQIHGAYWKSLVCHTQNMLTELGNNPPLTKAVTKNISNPVLILRGELDRMVGKEESVRMASGLKNGLFKSIPQITHPVEKQDPALILPYVFEFLKIS